MCLNMEYEPHREHSIIVQPCLVPFHAQVCQCYPEEMKGYPEELQVMLKQQAGVFHPDVRMVRIFPT